MSFDADNVPESQFGLNHATSAPKRRGRRKGTTKQVLLDRITSLERAVASEKQIQATILQSLTERNKAVKGQQGLKRKRKQTQQHASLLQASSLNHSYDIQAGISLCNAFVGSQCPSCAFKPIHFDSFFKQQPTPSIFRAYAMLALQQQYYDNKHYAVQFAKIALGIQNNIMDMPRPETAVGLMVLASYFFGVGDPHRAVSLIELADDMLSCLESIRRLRKGVSMPSSLAYNIKIIRLRLPQFSSTAGDEQTREYATGTLKVQNELLSKNIESGDGLLIKLHTLKALAEIQATQYARTGKTQYAKSCKAYMDDALELSELLPDHPIDKFYCQASASWVYRLLDKKEDAVKAAERVLDDCSWILRAKGVYPYIGLAAVWAWQTFDIYSMEKHKDELWKFLHPMALRYPLISVKLESTFCY